MGLGLPPSEFSRRNGKRSRALERVPPASEHEILAYLARRMAESGLVVDRGAIANLYTALKTRPLVVLTGPAGTGKIAAVECLAEALGCEGITLVQRMVGHSWWAQGCKSVSLFTQAQAVLNAEKFLALAVEAGLLRNIDRVHMALLSRISPAELGTLFEALSFQAEHAAIVRVPPIHLGAPLAYPTNLLLVGTLDHPAWEGVYPDDLWPGVMVIPWVGRLSAPRRGRGKVPRPNRLSFGRGFLRARFLKPAALSRVVCITRQIPCALLPLVRLVALLRERSASLAQAGLHQAMAYLGNAWSADGRGLFDLQPDRNLRVALDFAILQAILVPAGSCLGHGASWVDEARRILAKGFPRASAFLRAAA